MAWPETIAFFDSGEAVFRQVTDGRVVGAPPSETFTNGNLSPESAAPDLVAALHPIQWRRKLCWPPFSFNPER
jgi:hypothetical protein